MAPFKGFEIGASTKPVEGVQVQIKEWPRCGASPSLRVEKQF